MPRQQCERAIRDNPDRAEAYLVYGDLLQSEGDPRGDLIAVQHRLASEGESPALRQAEAALFAQHQEALLGSLAADGRADALVLTWRLGFIRAARLALSWDLYDQGVDAHGLLRDLMAHPSAAFMQRLTLGMVDFEGENFYDRCIEILVDAGPRPTMRHLFIGDFAYPDETEMSWTGIGDASRLWALYPRLHSLIVQGGSMQLGTLHLPELTSFAVRTGGLDTAAIESICAATWPALESLEIWFGSHQYGARGGIDDIAPILAGQGLPRLRRLSLRNTEFTDDLCAILAETTILAQLDTLDLSLGIMTDRGAHAIAAARQAFAHLQVLDVQKSYLTENGIKAIEGICPQVITKNQQSPYEYGGESYRYVSVGE